MPCAIARPCRDGVRIEHRPPTGPRKRRMLAARPSRRGKASSVWHSPPKAIPGRAVPDGRSPPASRPEQADRGSRGRTDRISRWTPANLRARSSFRGRSPPHAEADERYFRSYPHTLTDFSRSGPPKLGVSGLEIPYGKNIPVGLAQYDIGSFTAEKVADDGNTVQPALLGGKSGHSRRPDPIGRLLVHHAAECRPRAFAHPFHDLGDFALQQASMMVDVLACRCDRWNCRYVRSRSSGRDLHFLSPSTYSVHPAAGRD